MTITLDNIIELSKLIGAVSVIIAAIVGAVKWFLAHDAQKKDIADLRKHHDDDIKELRQLIEEGHKETNGELCVMAYTQLATLDGLKQLNCNGEVTKAHDMLEKHLNKKAHGQHI